MNVHEDKHYLCDKGFLALVCMSLLNEIYVLEKNNDCYLFFTLFHATIPWYCRRRIGTVRGAHRTMVQRY